MILINLIVVVHFFSLLRAFFIRFKLGFLTSANCSEHIFFKSQWQPSNWLGKFTSCLRKGSRRSIFLFFSAYFHNSLICENCFHYTIIFSIIFYHSFFLRWSVKSESCWFSCGSQWLPLSEGSPLSWRAQITAVHCSAVHFISFGKVNISSITLLKNDFIITFSINC